MTAQEILFQKYGDPRDPNYQPRYCTIWEAVIDFPWLANVKNSASGQPVRRILINKDFKAKLFEGFKLIEEAGLQGEIITYDGCYEARKSRTTNLLSLHYWAAATDLNAFQERLGSKITHWSPEFITHMKAAGLFWGGDFHGTKDPMHFALLDG